MAFSVPPSRLRGEDSAVRCLHEGRINFRAYHAFGQFHKIGEFLQYFSLPDLESCIVGLFGILNGSLVDPDGRFIPDALDLAVKPFILVASLT